MELELLTLQIAVILLVARLSGLAVRAIGQPQVVGEMIGGILLGPSVLGLIKGGAWMGGLFPPASMSYLHVLAQLGVMLFMFLVGLELDVKAVFAQGRRVAVAGFASVLGPFLGGLMVALLLWDFGHVRQGAPSGLAFVLFIATALSISAFPVLARILAEHNILRSRTGTLALACAAINDVVGWCILAVVFDVSKSLVLEGGEMSVASAVGHGVRTAVFAAIYVTAMVVVVRRILGRMQAHYESRGYLSRNVVALIFVLILASSLTTQVLGIHLIFGAFMLGAVMPSEPRFVRHVFEKIEDIALLFLLPIFFATIGLKTDLSLLSGATAWAAGGLLLLGAIGLKVGFSAWAARRTGLGTRESLLLGVLMSAHGVMELIIIDLGREMGAISPKAFTMMVVVIIASTVLVSPLVRLLYSRERLRTEIAPPTQEPERVVGLTVLVPVSLARTAAALVRVGAMLLGSASGRMVVLHLQRPHAPVSVEEAPQEDPVERALGEARRHGVAVRALSYMSRSPSTEIVDVASRYGAGWVVMGWHKPVFVQSILGGTVSRVLRDAKANVAIFVSRSDDAPAPSRVLVPYLGDAQDVGALAAAERLARLPGVRVTILHVVKPGRGAKSRLGVEQLVDRHVTSAGATGAVHMRVVESESPIDIVVEESHRFDLMVLGLAPQWNLEGSLTSILGAKEESVAQLAACNVLIVRGGVTPAIGSEADAGSQAEGEPAGSAEGGGER